MAKITLERKADTNLLTATVQTGEAQERYDCELTFCNNPACTCTTVEVTLLTGEDTTLANKEPGSNLFFRLDFDMKAVNPDGEILEGRNKMYAHLFAKHLGDDGWELLSREYHDYKTRITETADLSTISTNFPTREIDNEGMMIEYREILPFGHQIIFPIENDQIYVLDQHCVKINCTCAIVVLAFVSTKRKQSGNNRALEGVFFDYRTRKWDFTKADGNIGISGEDLKAALEQQCPDIGDKLKERHDTLSKLYTLHKNRLRTRMPELEATPQEIGRNAPCPCGSGKKHKRCCGKR